MVPRDHREEGGRPDGREGAERDTCGQGAAGAGQRPSTRRGTEGRTGPYVVIVEGFLIQLS